jgi:hypothetical protein
VDEMIERRDEKRETKGRAGRRRRGDGWWCDADADYDWQMSEDEDEDGRWTMNGDWVGKCGDITNWQVTSENKGGTRAPQVKEFLTFLGKKRVSGNWQMTGKNRWKCLVSNCREPKNRLNGSDRRQGRGRGLDLKNGLAIRITV